MNYSEKATSRYRKDFGYKDIDESETIDPSTGEKGRLLELFEVYEKYKYQKGL